METFLKLTAKDLFTKYCDPQKGLSGITVVFPNRRARLFFDEELSHCCDRPVWSPEYTTIQDLFQSQSHLRIADRVELVTMLYDVYCRIMHSNETLDSFWSWGELMLSDFDDIDRNMAPAAQLFKALKDQKELSDMSFLTDEQAAALHRFFGEIKSDEEPTRLRKEYDRIWKSLGEIYNTFTSALSDSGMAYNGMLQRRVIETLDTSNFKSDKYVFIGFNSLDTAEKGLFQALRDAGKAIFYWDHDIYYTGQRSLHEAGRFMRRNLIDFPGELDGQPLFDNIGKNKNLTIVETSTDNAQARYIPQWLDSLNGKTGRDTAIVLCDENLLQPVLHCIPAEKTDGVNITMGYPLSQTPLFSLVSAMLELQRTAARNGGRFTLTLVSRVLANPLVSSLSDKALETLEELRKARRMFPEISELQKCPDLSPFFQIAKDNSALLQYILDILKSLVPVITENKDNTLFMPLMQESLYRTYTQINRLRTLIGEGRLAIQTETLCRLVRTMLTSTTVPFHGEPVIGMQIMGLIETRNLDFKNVLILSAGEGTLPSTSGNASFIPYNVRKAFGLTSMEDKSAVSSYNFYHLLQRAENVTMVYNGDSDAPGIGKGLISRYLLQLTVSGRPICRISLKSVSSESVPTSVSVEKSPEVLARLCGRYDSSNPKTFLSPSALKKYINCPLSFYLAQIAGLRKSDETETEIDVAMFGTLLHKSAELAYNRLKKGGTVTSDSINALLDDEVALSGIVCDAFNDSFFGEKVVKLEDYSGTQSVNHGVILKYLKQILTLDATCYAPFDYIASETSDYEHFINVPDPLNEGGTLRIRLKGIIDRMDRKDGIYRIVDYKTGTKRDYPKTLDDVFDPEKFHQFDHAFQIFYYAYVLCSLDEFKDRKIAPTLLYTRSTSKPNPDDLYYRIGDHPVKDFSVLAPQFEEKLMSVVRDIFDPSKPFAPTTNEKACKFCDFFALCHPDDDYSNAY